MVTIRSLCLLILLILAAPFNLEAGEIHRVAPPGNGPMPQISSTMSIAFGPDGGFAAWRVNFGEMWGVPLDRDGMPKAPARLILSDVLGTISPAVQFIGGSFTLWWQNTYPPVARTARLDYDGNVIEAKTLTIGASPVASNARLTLAFGNSFNDPAIHFFDIGGALVRSAPLMGVDRPYQTQAVALQDGSFALVSTNYSGLYLIRFSAGGEQLGAPLLIEANRGTTSLSYRPLAGEVATDGSSLFVIWAASAYEQRPEVKSVIVARDNALSSQKTHGSLQWKTNGQLQAEWASGFYTVALAAGHWEGRETDDLDIYAARFSASGELVSNFFVPVVKRPGLEMNMTMQTSNGKHLFFFHQGDYGMNELLVASLPGSGSLSRADPGAIDARLSDSAAWQKWSVAASDGSGWLVVWVEQLANREEIRSAPLHPDGTPAAGPTTLASAYRYLGRPAVAFNGIDYVVSWNQGRTLLAKRLLRNGTAIDAQPLAIAADPAAFGDPLIAAGGGLSLIAWVSTAGVHAALLHADGRTTPPVLVSPPSRDEQGESISYEDPVVAAGRDSFLVAFAERRTTQCVGIPCPSETRARARIVARDGVPRGTVKEFDGTGPSSAAAAGGTYLLMFDGSVRAVILDEAAAQLVRTLSFTNSGVSIVKAFAAAGEYLVVSPLARSALLLDCLSPDGSACGTRRAETFALTAAAVSPAGTVLVAATLQMRGVPYFGAPAVLAQVIDSFRPAFRERRRAARR